MASIQEVKKRAEARKKAEAEAKENELREAQEAEKAAKQRELDKLRYKPSEEDHKAFLKYARLNGIEKARVWEFEKIKALAVGKHKTGEYHEAIEHYGNACKLLFSEFYWGEKCQECGALVTPYSWPATGPFNEHQKVCPHGQPEENHVDKIRICYYVFCKSSAAQCCTNIDDYRGAIHHATDALARDPSNVKALYRRGLAFLAMGKNDEATADFNKSDRKE
jgi:tetratricopeptide (TPR) repeat protein